MFHSIAKVIKGKSVGVRASRSVVAAIVLAKINSLNGDRWGNWQAIKFQNGRVTIVAPSAIEAQELVWRKSELLSEVKLLFDHSTDQPIITDLIIRT